MDNSDWSRKLLKSTKAIKDALSVELDQVIDGLMEKEIIGLEAKEIIDSKTRSAAKIDYMIKVINSGGKDSYDAFLDVLRGGGNHMRRLAHTITQTHVPPENTNDMKRRNSRPQINPPEDSGASGASGASGLTESTLVRILEEQLTFSEERNQKKMKTEMAKMFQEESDRQLAIERSKNMHLRGIQMGLRQQKSEDRDRICRLNTEKERLKAENAALRSELRRLKDAYDVLNPNLNNSSHESGNVCNDNTSPPGNTKAVNDTLKTENEELETEIQKHPLDDIEAENDYLKIEDKELETEIEELPLDNIEAENDYLKTENEELKTEIQSIIEKHNQPAKQTAPNKLNKHETLPPISAKWLSGSVADSHHKNCKQASK